MPTLVLYSYFLFTVSANLKQDQTLFLMENPDLAQKKKKQKKIKEESTLFLSINVIYYYYCYFLSNPIFLVPFTLTAFPPHPCRSACWLPITGRLKHLGAGPAQLYMCHCPAVCRAAHMATGPVEWADRQLHPRGNVSSIIRKPCIRISYNQSSIKQVALSPTFIPSSRIFCLLVGL